MYVEKTTWTDEFGAFVASLRDEALALAIALAPEAAGHTYLTQIGGNSYFSVLYGLQQWPVRKMASVNDDRLVALKENSTTTSTHQKWSSSTGTTKSCSTSKESRPCQKCGGRVSPG